MTKFRFNSLTNRWEWWDNGSLIFYYDTISQEDKEFWLRYSDSVNVERLEKLAS